MISSRIKVSPGLHSAELSRHSVHVLQVQIILTKCSTLLSLLLIIFPIFQAFMQLVMVILNYIPALQSTCNFSSLLSLNKCTPNIVKKRNGFRPTTDICTTQLHKFFDREQHTTTVSFLVLCPPTWQ